MSGSVSGFTKKPKGKAQLAPVIPRPAIPYLKLGFPISSSSGFLPPGTTKPVHYPSAAAWISVVSSGTAWANGSWVQVVAATTKAGYVTGFEIGGSISSTGQLEIDIGTGTSGSQVVIATVGHAFYYDSVAGTYQYPFLPVIPPQSYAASATLWVRMRASWTSQTLGIALQCAE